ncbi:MAG: hypothetical protein ACRENE_01125 [Polyangiaceae bacterium]
MASGAVRDGVILYLPKHSRRATGLGLPCYLVDPGQGGTLRQLPRIYDQIMIIGGGSPPTDGRPVAKVGGFWRSCEYGLAYLLAARYVVDSAEADKRQNETALPAVHLQRHALEVALKDLIATARAVKADGAWLEALKSEPHAPRPAVAPVPRKHDLAKLVGLLRESLSEIGYGDVPATFLSVAERIKAIERDDPSRLRYATDSHDEESFRERILIPIGELQDELEAAFDAHLYLDSTFQIDNLATNLAMEQLALEQALQRVDGYV